MSHPRAVALRHTESQEAAVLPGTGVYSPLCGATPFRDILVAFPCPCLMSVEDLSNGALGASTTSPRLLHCCQSRWCVIEWCVFSSEMQPVVNERTHLALLSQTLPVSPMKNIRSRLQKCGIYCMMYFYLVAYFWIHSKTRESHFLIFSVKLKVPVNCFSGRVRKNSVPLAARSHEWFLFRSRASFLSAQSAQLCSESISYMV